MKKRIAAFMGAAVLMVVISLTACGRSLPEPAVVLPVKLASFNYVKYDYDMELGDYQHQFKLSKAQQTEFQRLLQADRWFDPGELPGRGYTSVIDADNDEGWGLTIGYWDEAYTLIALYNEDQPEKTFYFAPFEVQEAAEKFRDTLKG